MKSTEEKEKKGNQPHNQINPHGKKMIKRKQRRGDDLEKAFSNLFSSPSSRAIERKKRKEVEVVSFVGRLIERIKRKLLYNLEFLGDENLNSIWPPIEEWSKQEPSRVKIYCSRLEEFRYGLTNFSHINDFSTFMFHAECDYNKLMDFSENLFSGMIKQSLQRNYQLYPNGINKEAVMTDLSFPFRRISVIEELEKMANLNIPKDFSSYETNQYLVDACAKYGIDCTPPLTTARLLDKLVAHFLVETCVNPTFIMDYPEIMNPLAKRHRSKPGLTESFKLFICNHEFCNGYAALKDPDEFTSFGETSTTVLQHGLHPTGALSLAISRLFVLITRWWHTKERGSFQGHRMECE